MHTGIHRALNPSLFATEARDVNISFEFFPPKTEKMAQTLWSSVETLSALDPSFVSVTYGAGGTTRERTHDTVKRIASETPIPVAAHLTCVGASKGEINDIIHQYKEAGVRHIVALRGDVPEDNGGGSAAYSPHPDGYKNAADLVTGIRAIGDFDISVAAYPEMHPDSPNLAADLDNLKRKIDAGANRAITQFFFESDSYFRFLDHCESYGIDVPIVPGILPVTNFKSLKQFAGACGATVPDWLGRLFEDLDEKPQTRGLVAATVAGELCSRLYQGGVRDFHFYTLNRAELSYAICHMLGHRPKQADDIPVDAGEK